MSMEYELMFSSRFNESYSRVKTHAFFFDIVIPLLLMFVPALIAFVLNLILWGWKIWKWYSQRLSSSASTTSSKASNNAINNTAVANHHHHNSISSNNHIRSATTSHMICSSQMTIGKFGSSDCISLKRCLLKKTTRRRRGSNSSFASMSRYQRKPGAARNSYHLIIILLNITDLPYYGFMMYNLYQNYYDKSNAQVETSEGITRILYLFGHSINIFIYVLFHQDFRVTVCKVIGIYLNIKYSN